MQKRPGRKRGEPRQAILLYLKTGFVEMLRERKPREISKTIEEGLRLANRFEEYLPELEVIERGYKVQCLQCLGFFPPILQTCCPNCKGSEVMLLSAIHQEIINNKTLPGDSSTETELGKSSEPKYGHTKKPTKTSNSNVRNVRKVRKKKRTVKATT